MARTFLLRLLYSVLYLSYCLPSAVAQDATLTLSGNATTSGNKTLDNGGWSGQGSIIPHYVVSASQALEVHFVNGDPVQDVFVHFDIPLTGGLVGPVTGTTSTYFDVTNLDVNQMKSVLVPAGTTHVENMGTFQIRAYVKELAVGQPLVPVAPHDFTGGETKLLVRQYDGPARNNVLEAYEYKVAVEGTLGFSYAGPAGSAVLDQNPAVVPMGSGASGTTWTLNLYTDTEGGLYETADYAVVLGGVQYGLGTLNQGEDEWFFTIDEPKVENDTINIYNKTSFSNNADPPQLIQVSVAKALITAQVAADDIVRLKIENYIPEPFEVVLWATLTSPASDGHLYLVDGLGNAYIKMPFDDPDKLVYHAEVSIAPPREAPLFLTADGYGVTSGLWRQWVLGGGNPSSSPSVVGRTEIFRRAAPPYQPRATFGGGGMWEVTLDPETGVVINEIPEPTPDAAEQFTGDPSEAENATDATSSETSGTLGDGDDPDPIQQITNADLDRYLSQFIGADGTVNEVAVTLSEYTDSQGNQQTVVMTTGPGGTTLTDLSGADTASQAAIVDQVIANTASGSSAASEPAEADVSRSAAEGIPEGVEGAESAGSAVASAADSQYGDGTGFAPDTSGGAPSGFWDITLPGQGPGGTDAVLSFDILNSEYSWIPALLKNLIVAATTLMFMVYIWNQIHDYQKAIAATVQLKLPNITVMGNTVSMFAWPLIAGIVTTAIAAMPTLISGLAFVVTPAGVSGLFDTAIDTATSQTAGAAAWEMFSGFIPVVHLLTLTGNFIVFIFARNSIFRLHSSIMKHLPAN